MLPVSGRTDCLLFRAAQKLRGRFACESPSARLCRLPWADSWEGDDGPEGLLVHISSSAFSSPVQGGKSRLCGLSL